MTAGKLRFIKWFGHFERRINKNVVKKTSGTGLEKNQRRGRPKKKQMGEDNKNK